MLLIAALICCGQAYAGPREPDGNLDFLCNVFGACPARAVPGAPDRDVRPFTGALGRPCAWRERPTPQGPRRVRTCW